MNFNFALVGNPNCGKTTLFNYLTKNKAHVGNWPGVTIEKKEGSCNFENHCITIIDLPGIYSLSPYSKEEIISRDYILKDKPDLIINVADATNIERSLYLTSQLIEIGIPVIIALNMIDEIEKRGDKLNVHKMESKLGVKVVPISAVKKTGIKKLMNESIDVVINREATCKTILYNTQVYEYIKKIAFTAKENGEKIALFYSVKLLERDNLIRKQLKLDKTTQDKIDLISYEGEKNINTDWETKISYLRYKYITDLIKDILIVNKDSNKVTFTDKIDNFITNRYLSIPIFIFIMFLVFQITFGKFGSYLKESMEFVINDIIILFIKNTLIDMKVSNLLISLIVDGIGVGIGMVMSFLPQILLLFLFLSILEDTGYMSRAAFIMDKVLRNFGLSGKSFVPMLMGFGCSVPAIMSARTLKNNKDRLLTIMLIPFMSCGARMPVYAVFTNAFFKEKKGIIILSLYLIGILVAFISGILLNSTILKGESEPFIMELPKYRIPSIDVVINNIWSKMKDFITKTFSILLISSIIIWFLKTFDFSLNVVLSSENSIFGEIGKNIAPLFKPLGFGNWKASVALLSGFIAKEAVVSTLSILYLNSDIIINSNFSLVLSNYFTPISAYSYMVFVLLYTPCIAAFAAIKKETNSWKWAIFAVIFQTSIAWTAAFVIYQIGNLII